MPTIIDNGTANTVVVERTRNVGVAVRSAATVSVTSPGPQGPAGVNGADGGTYTTKLANAALGGHRIVRAVSATHVDYASADEITHGDDILGLTLGSASSGATVQIADGQDVTEPSWTWTPQEPLYLGLNGLVTQTPPDTPSVIAVVVGFATSATSARIRIEPPIYL